MLRLRKLPVRRGCVRFIKMSFIIPRLRLAAYYNGRSRSCWPRLSRTQTPSLKIHYEDGTLRYDNWLSCFVYMHCGALFKRTILAHNHLGLPVLTPSWFRHKSGPPDTGHLKFTRRYSYQGD